MKQLQTLWALLVMGSLLAACQPEPATPYYAPEPEISEEQILGKYFDLSTFPSKQYTYRVFWEKPHTQMPVSSWVEDKSVDLGRAMFYDKNLSADGTVSCASCHHQHLAFGDSTAFSTGIYGHQTARNSFALATFLSFINYYHTVTDSGSALPQLFWDNRANSVEDQTRETLANPHEMAMNPAALPAKLKELEYYPVLYKRIYDTRSWDDNPEKLLRDLASFMFSFSSESSPFDQELKRMKKAQYSREDFTNDFVRFTPSQNLGKSLFFENCASCHGRFLAFETDRLFTEVEGTAACNGLDEVYTDKGVGKVQNDPNLDGFFKIPSLKNIEVTAPYMHDGRFGTLREVIEFYNEGIQPHANLHPLLQDLKGNPKRFHFSETEIDALVDFLHTLTDEKILTDEKWSDPFLR